jgi:protein-arginine kinase activator protein McsA
MKTEITQIQNLLDAGYTQKDIGLALGLTTRQVSYRIKKHELKRSVWDLHTFVKDATKKFGDKFTYNYLAETDTLEVTCKYHGVTKQKPKQHLESAKGCPKCARKALTQAGFLFRCKRAHGSTYSYEHTEYVNMRSDITYICNKHGKVTQNARAHIKGSGCPKCRAGMTFEEFNLENVKTYGNRYTFEERHYNGFTKETFFFCNNHLEKGLLKTKPSDHLHHESCKYCRKVQMVKDIGGEDKVDRFSYRAFKIHGNKLTYQLEQYTTRSKPIECMCNVCYTGFEETPANILEGIGCPACHYVNTYTYQTFLSEATEEHGDKYEYVASSFVHREKPMTAICKIHGAFIDTPENIGYGDGCPHCDKN